MCGTLNAAGGIGQAGMLGGQNPFQALFAAQQAHGGNPQAMFEDVAVAGIPIDQLFAQFMGGVAAAHEEPPAGEGAAVPAPAGMIQNLEEVCLDKGTVESGNDECGVCLIEQHVGDLAVVLDCGHAFHKSCLVPWLERNCICPACRLPLNPDHSTRSERTSGQRHRERQEAQRQQHEEEVRQARERMNEMNRRERESQSAAKAPKLDGARDAAQARAAESRAGDGAPATGDAPVTGSVPNVKSRDELRGMGVRELKKQLDERGVSYAGVLEKSGLVDLLFQHQSER